MCARFLLAETISNYITDEHTINVYGSLYLGGTNGVDCAVKKDPKLVYLPDKEDNIVPVGYCQTCMCGLEWEQYCISHHNKCMQITCIPYLFRNVTLILSCICGVKNTFF